ncbi:nitroreductase family protein [Paenibacillus tuaregi]|uniref:nitroreductase family protein n=1 Tax=Paenibacillus tuaregi TaxID=1816681 RepID=UPI00083806FE|nr:nitroreductase family protein [Paenibacillus tuaregi]
MEWMTLIKERRSIRKFNPTPVDQELVLELLRAARELYPTGETVDFRCVYAGTADSRERLAACMLEPLVNNKLVKWLPEKVRDFVRRRVTDIPGHLAIIATTDADRRKSDMNYAAVCGILQNFQLLAWQRQLGVLWDTEPMMQSKDVFHLLKMKPNERLVGIFHLGYFDKTPKARARTRAEKKWTSLSDQPASEVGVLELLNAAVWAPNDGMREPWRFIFVGSGRTDIMSGLQDQAPAYLILVTKEDADHHKREEDFAAVSCLMQNFRLLAQESKLHIRMTMNDWIYDRTCTHRFGVQQDERILAVLEMGDPEQTVEFVKADGSPELAFELL